MVKESPFAWFFLLTFGFSWTMWLASFGLFFPVSLKMNGYLHSLGIFGPTFAAITLTGIIKGKKGLFDLLKRITYWRVGVQWYLFVIFSPIIFGLIARGIYGMLGGTPLPITYSFYYPDIIFLCLNEELGWRGFALPLLQRKYSALKSAIIIGLIWVVWHFLIIPDSFLFISIFMVDVVVLSIFFTWVYNNTKGSILLAALYHTVLNLVLFDLKIPLDPGLYFTNLAVELVFLSIIIWKFGSKDLSISSKRVTYQF